MNIKHVPLFLWMNQELIEEDGRNTLGSPKSMGSPCAQSANQGGMHAMHVIIPDELKL